jgi:CubicO group peptidase (beta-lactamase class C family)
MFTAALVLQLVDEGKLKLTNTIDKFFQQIPNAENNHRTDPRASQRYP